MNARLTCKECGQLRVTSAKITEIKNEENSNKIVLEFTSQIDRDKNIIQAFMRQGVKITQSGNTLCFEAEDVVTDAKPETTVTQDAAPQAPQPAAKRRGRQPATPKDD